MAKMRYEKAQRNKSNIWVFSGSDSMYGEYIPDMSKSEEAKKQDIHPEIRKMLYSTLPESNEYSIRVTGEREAQEYEEFRELAVNYFEAKQRFFDDAFEN